MAILSALVVMILFIKREGGKEFPMLISACITACSLYLAIGNMKKKPLQKSHVKLFNTNAYNIIPIIGIVLFVVTVNTLSMPIAYALLLFTALLDSYCSIRNTV